MTLRTFGTNLVGVPLIIVGLLLTSNVSLAQATDTLEEVIVTATRRETNLQQTPISITAVTAATLSAFNISSPEAMLSSIVGMEGTISAGNLALAIRGVNSENTDLTSDPTVAFHVDGVFLGRQSGGVAVFQDLARVETLRGPQGTLYGRNATGGSINVITAKPTQNFEGSVEVTAGNYNQLGFRGVLNAPVIEDKVAVRLAVMKDDRDGYMQNGPSISRPYGDSHVSAYRFHTLLTPNDKMSLLFTADYQDRDGVGDGTNTLSGVNANLSTSLPAPLVLFQNRQGSRKDEFATLKGELNYSFDNFNLVYIGARYKSDVNLALDLDRTDVFADLLDIKQGSHQWSHEMRLLSNDDGRLQWLAGLFYFDEDASRYVKTEIPRFANLKSITDTPTYNVKSQSIFSQVTYNVSDKLRITGGLRYTQDDKTQGDTVYTRINNFGTTVLRVTNGDSWTSTDWTIGFDWFPIEDTMIYAKVGTGFKAGGYNVANPAFAVAESTFLPEEILAYQVGHKSTFKDGRLRINSEAFYYDYTDLQVFQRVDMTSITANAASAKIYGFETELSATPIKALNVSLGVGYLNAKYGKFILFNPFSLRNDDLAGSTLVKAPTWSVNASIDYKFKFENGWQVIPRLRSSYRSDQKLLPFNELGSLQKSRTATDASIDLVPAHDRYRLRLFVNNLENDIVWSGAGTTGTGAGTVRVLTGRPPLFYGVNFSAAFGQ